MRNLFGGAVLLSLLLIGSASAQEALPDLRGTWSGEGDGVFVTAPGPKTDAHFGAVSISLVVDEQRDRRFSGTITMSNWTRPVVGVITYDGGILWSEPAGFVQGRLTDANTLEGCFVRISTFSQLAACEILKRQ